MGIVRLLATGGTIATIGTGAAARPALDAGALGVASGLAVETEQVSQQPSWALGPEDMWRLAIRVRDVAGEDGVAGVVVTHGTSTLELSAFLADLYLAGDVPVVFTGAMRRADDPAPDGPTNLRASIELAGSAQARGLGVLVCFAGEILSAREAWKAERSAERAFIGLAGGVGRMGSDGPKIHRRPVRPRPFTTRVEPRVALVKAYPGAGGALLRAAVGAGVRGIVVEGFPGAGGVPPPMHAALGETRAAGVLIALASRAPFGRLPDAGGGTGSPLAGLDLMSAGDLTAEKAWVLLCAALGETADAGEARRRFEQVALGEGGDAWTSSAPRA